MQNQSNHVMFSVGKNTVNLQRILELIEARREFPNMDPNSLSVAVLGPAGVGKSTVVNNMRGCVYCEDDDGEIKPSLGCENLDSAKRGDSVESTTLYVQSYPVDLPNSTKLYMWDFAGFGGARTEPEMRIMEALEARLTLRKINKLHAVMVLVKYEDVFARGGGVDGGGIAQVLDDLCTLLRISQPNDLNGLASKLVFVITQSEHRKGVNKNKIVDRLKGLHKYFQGQIDAEGSAWNKMADRLAALLKFDDERTDVTLNHQKLMSQLGRRALMLQFMIDGKDDRLFVSDVFVKDPSYATQLLKKFSGLSQSAALDTAQFDFSYDKYANDFYVSCQDTLDQCNKKLTIYTNLKNEESSLSKTLEAAKERLGGRNAAHVHWQAAHDRKAKLALEISELEAQYKALDEKRIAARGFRFCVNLDAPSELAAKTVYLYTDDADEGWCCAWLDPQGKKCARDLDEDIADALNLMVKDSKKGVIIDESAVSLDQMKTIFQRIVAGFICPTIRADNVYGLDYEIEELKKEKKRLSAKELVLTGESYEHKEKLSWLGWVIGSWSTYVYRHKGYYDAYAFKPDDLDRAEDKRRIKIEIGGVADKRFIKATYESDSGQDGDASFKVFIYRCNIPANKKRIADINVLLDGDKEDIGKIKRRNNSRKDVSKYKKELVKIAGQLEALRKMEGQPSTVVSGSWDSSREKALEEEIAAAQARHAVVLVNLKEVTGYLCIQYPMMKLIQDLLSSGLQLNREGFDVLTASVFVKFNGERAALCRAREEFAAVTGTAPQRPDSGKSVLPPKEPRYPRRPPQPPVTVLQQGLFNGHQYNFTEYQVSPDGNCGFTALGPDRDAAVKALLENANDLEIRKIVSFEIRAAAMEANVRLPQVFKTTEAISLCAAYRNTVDKLNAKRGTAGKAATAEKNFNEWCMRKEVFEGFVSSYKSEHGRQWLTFIPGNEGRAIGIFDAIVKIRKIPGVCVWQQGKTTDGKLSVIHHYGDISHATHILFTGNHFNFLVENVANNSVNSVSSGSVSSSSGTSQSRFGGAKRKESPTDSDNDFGQDVQKKAKVSESVLVSGNVQPELGMAATATSSAIINDPHTALPPITSAPALPNSSPAPAIVDPPLLMLPPMGSNVNTFFNSSASMYSTSSVSSSSSSFPPPPPAPADNNTR